MGREIRRVPANWDHPKITKFKSFKRIEETGYQPIFDRPYIEAITEWIKDHAAWEAGTHADLCGEDPVSKEECAHFAEWSGNPPDVEFYRPNWKPEEMTWYQVYETVSEGTPVTPPFATQEELIDYLVANGDFWDQSRRADTTNKGAFHMPCDPWPRANAERFVKVGSACSLIVSPEHGIQSGVQALTNT